MHCATIRTPGHPACNPVHRAHRKAPNCTACRRIRTTVCILPGEIALGNPGRPRRLIFRRSCEARGQPRQGAGAGKKSPAGGSKTAAEKAFRIHPTYPRGCTGTSHGRHASAPDRARRPRVLLRTTWLSLFVLGARGSSKRCAHRR
jgi:hypothetical protein